MTALAKHIGNAPIGFMQTKDVIEILKGLMGEEIVNNALMGSVEAHEIMGINKAVSEQNAKIQAVINKLEKEGYEYTR